MRELREIYNLREDTTQIKAVQKASSDKNSFAGYEIENNLLFGTKEWFKSIEEGKIKSHVVRGKISKILMSGHNDFAEFEIESNSGFSIWTMEGLDSTYEVGRQIELIYVEQKYKRPSDITGVVSRCVLKISIED